MAYACTRACVLHWDRRASYQWKWNMLHLIPPVQHLAEQGLQLSTEQGLVR